MILRSADLSIHSLLLISNLQLENEEAELLRQIEEIDMECKRLDTELLVEMGKQNDIREEEEEYVWPLFMAMA